MNFDLVVRAGRNRQLVAMVALAVWALGAAACSSGGGSGGAGGGAGKATGGAGGTGTGGVAGAAGAAPDGGTDAPVNPDAATDIPPLPCIVDGGDASGDCCPDDPAKTQPGQCGCGTPDTDSDSDGVADCHDTCPEDPGKVAPGPCGCFVPETDTDNDGTPDCNDACPQNPTRVAAGLCGCALPDTAAPFCLAHRYSFNDGVASDGGASDAGDADAGGDAGGGGTTMVRDSVGTANGTAMGVLLRGTGSLTLAGGLTDQYVSLPSGIISSLGSSATIEGWVTWPGTGGSWQRIFDFGVADPTMPGMQGAVGTSFVFLTPVSGAGVALLSVNTGGLTEVMSPTFFPQTPIAMPGPPHHFAAVIDAAGSGDAGGPNAALYIDGVLIGRTALISQLMVLQDVNNWLGRSQFVADPEFSGTYYEFRIHSSALTPAQITASINAGPDALP